MNKNLTLFTLLLAGGTCVTHNAHAALLSMSSSVQIGVTTCTGAHSNCNVTINAVGDVITVDVKNTPIKDLGTLSSEKVAELAMPKEPGTHEVYSFTPSEGELTNTKIYLLVQNVEQARGTRRADMNVFKLSRQLPGNKPNEWTEVGDLEVKKTETLTQMPFFIKKDGTMITFDTSGVKGTGAVTINTDEQLPQGVREVTFHVGTKDLT